MKVSLEKPVQYSLNKNSESFLVNDWVGKKLTITNLNEIKCISCGAITAKSFAGGFCYDCFQNSPLNSECIIHPELCRGHLGEGRDPDWEERYHNQPHVVYLSYTGDFKVGVTSASQTKTRWIDQGAIAAIVLAEVPYRQLAGEIEVFCKSFIADKTNWSKMLKTHKLKDSITEVKNEVANRLSDRLSKYVSSKKDAVNITYPQVRGFEKYTQINLENTESASGELCGIKGQYLIFENGKVLNVRKHAGYKVQIEIEENPVLSLF